MSRKKESEMKKKHIVFIVLVFLLLLFSVYFIKPKHKVTEPVLEETGEINFETIVTNMVGGGPPKDGIPSIDKPEWIKPEDYQGILSNEEQVYAYVLDGQARAIPQEVMYWHEIVNEKVNGEEFSVTYCPLTGTVIGFKDQELGVSGKLYNSNLVVYDRATDSEIPQILQTAVNGPSIGERGNNFYVYTTTWGKWKEKYPNTLVLSQNTGVDRDYTKNPYPGYDALLRVWFPVAAESDLFHSKKIVHGVEYNGKFLAIPKEEFSKVGEDKYTLAGEELSIRYEDDLDVIKIYKGAEQVNSFDAYWFAWYAYHPNTEVWE